MFLIKFQQNPLFAYNEALRDQHKRLVKDKLIWESEPYKQIPNTVTWEQGQDFPIPFDVIDAVGFVQATRLELFLVLGMVEGIPKPSESVNLINNKCYAWFGDDAKFICAFLIQTVESKRMTELISHK